MGEPFVHIFIDKYKIGKPFLFDCVQNRDPSDPKKSTVKPLQLVIEFEELCLQQLQDEDNPSRKHFESNMKWLANQLGKNIFFFIGHSDKCDDYVKSFYYKIGTLLTNTLPSIFLIIGCEGDELATFYNTDVTYQSLRDRGVVFFGFKHLVHIYNGDIYSCKEPHHKMPNMDCDYAESSKNRESLLNSRGALNQTKLATEKNNRLLRCCSLKFDRFASTFAEYLNKRLCVKYTKEKLLEKIVKLTNPTSTQQTTFYPENGIACTESGNCEIANPYKPSEELAAEYDNNLEGVYEKIVPFLQAINKDRGNAALHIELLKALDELKGSELQVLNYTEEDGAKIYYYGNILLNIVHFGLPDLALHIIRKYADVVDLLTVNIANDTLFHVICYEIDSEHDLVFYELTKYILERKPKLVSMFDSDSTVPLALLLKRNAKPYLQLVIDALKTEKPFDILQQYANIDALQTLAFHNINDIQTWKLLLRHNANPNVVISRRTVMDIFLDKYPPYNGEILKLLCIYGYNDRETLLKKFSKYQEDTKSEANIALSLEGMDAVFRLMKKRLSYHYKKYWISDKFVNGRYVSYYKPTLYMDDEFLRDKAEHDEMKHLMDNYKEIIGGTLALLQECLDIILLPQERKEEMKAQINAESDAFMRNYMEKVEEQVNPIKQMEKMFERIDKSLTGKISITKEEKKAYRAQGVQIMKQVRDGAKHPLEARDELSEILRTIEDKLASPGAATGGRRRTTRKGGLLRLRKHTRKHRKN